MTQDIGRSAEADGLSQAEPKVSALRASIPSAEEARIEYRFSHAPWMAERHDWIILSDAGAVSIWAEPTTSIFDGRKWYGGIECHYSSPPDYMDQGEASHACCWILNAPCWHDGSSLQFSEQIAPYLPEPAGAPMGARELAMVRPILRNRYREWLASAIEAGTDATPESGAAVGESAVPQGDATPTPRGSK